MSSRLRVAILGATGSIGRQALDVCRQHADKIKVIALASNTSVKEVVDAAHEFGVAAVGFADARVKDDAYLNNLPESTEVVFGDSGVASLAARDDVDCVLNAVVGFAGIWAGLAALKAQKRLAYANKESIVVGGDLLLPLAQKDQIIPVDSEHSAIFECLYGESRAEAEKIWLTCSGGPFFGRSIEELKSVTAKDALAHPTWDMGAKITIDSATLMNKGLEVIEAKRLFDVDIDDVSVVIHRQSIIHSMVQFKDGAVKAQLGPSDMRMPIQYAFSFPNRWDASCHPLDFYQVGACTFDKPDEITFRSLSLAREAGRMGGTMPCVLNAANEVANAAFRHGACGFLDIASIVEDAIDAFSYQPVVDIEQLRELDAAVRRWTHHKIECR